MSWKWINPAWWETEPQTCIHAGINCTKSAPLCCGTCDNQFCCDNSNLELKQNSCDSCVGYTTMVRKTKTKIEAQRCDAEEKGEFCCGFCGKRFCCTNSTLKLFQPECDSLWRNPSFITFIVMIILVFFVGCCGSIFKKLKLSC